MGWTIVAGTFAAVTLIIMIVWVGNRYVGVGEIYRFAPDNGAALADSRTEDGSYIVPMAQRPHYAEKCSKRVRGQVYQGFCW